MAKDNSRTTSYGRAAENVSETSRLNHELARQPTFASWRRAIFDFIPPAAALLDIILIASSAGLAKMTYLGSEGGLPLTLFLSTAAGVIFVLTTSVLSLYDATQLLNWNRQLKHVLVAGSCALVSLPTLFFFMEIGTSGARQGLLLFTLGSCLLLLASRRLWRFALSRAFASRLLSGPRAVLIGQNLESAEINITEHLQRQGFSVLRIYDLADRSRSGPDDIISMMRSWDVEKIFLADDGEGGLVRGILPWLRIYPVSVTLIAGRPALGSGINSLRPMKEVIAIEVKRQPLSEFERALKRTIDILLASFGLILLTPCLPLVALAIKFDSAGPILFMQRRIGFDGRSFNRLKFRTMTVMEDGHSISARSPDYRITKIGHLLRRAGIDGAPQFINVLRGEMSIVGPRPQGLLQANRVAEEIWSYAFRHHFKPGLTSWAQVNGACGDEVRQFEHDIWYMNNWSAWLDIRITLRALSGVLGYRGAEETASRRATADRAVVRRAPSFLSVGRHSYPLRQTTTMSYDGAVMRLGGLEVIGSTWDTALNLMSRRLHRDFQRLWLVPPHERTASQQTELDVLIKIIDLEAYLRVNREEELAIGRIDAVDDYVVRLTLLTHEDRKIEAQISELPAVAAGMQGGEFFEARILVGDRGQVEWRNWSVRPPVREDDDVWTDFDRLVERGKLNE